MDIQTKLRVIRAAKNLSQTGLAELYGVSLQTVWRWENGENEPLGPARVLIDRDYQAIMDNAQHA